MAKTMLAEPPAPLLPTTLGKLRRVAEGNVGDGLDRVDAADAPVMTEDGLRRFARSQYAAEGAAEGAIQGSLAVYQFGDVSGAVSAFDYFRRPGMRSEKLGDDALSSGNELLLRSGANVVVEHLSTGHGSMIGLSKELIDHLPKVVGAAGIAPLLPTLVPAHGLDAGSVRYALGPAGYKAMGGVLPAWVVGFGKSAEAVTASNGSGGELTLLLYPTPEIAGEHEQEIAVLNRQPDSAKNASDAQARVLGTGRASTHATTNASANVATQTPANSAIQTADQKTTRTLMSGPILLGTVKMRREGTLLLLTTGTWPESEAEHLVDGIHLRQEVTWDKPIPPDFNTELRKTYSLLVNIALLSGIFCLAALILGVFLGGGRALVRVLLGKPAAREPEFLRIDLSGAVGKNLLSERLKEDQAGSSQVDASRG